MIKKPTNCEPIMYNDVYVTMCYYDIHRRCVLCTFIFIS